MAALSSRWLVLLVGLGASAGCRSDVDSKASGSASRSTSSEDAESGQDVDGSDGADGGGVGEDGGADGGESGTDGAGDDGDDGDHGGDGPRLTDLDFSLDAPAFYDASETVVVSGVAVLDGGELREVEVNGVTVPVESGLFAAEIELGGAPWSVVTVTARVGEETATLVAQAAQAEAVSGPIDEGMRGAVDRVALDALGAHLSNHLNAADMAPTAGVELARKTCPGSPVPGMELTEHTEIVRTDGGVSFTPAVVVDPETGALVLDLENSTLTWTLERLWESEAGTLTGSLDATATVGAPAAAAGSCTGIGLAVQSDVTAHSWAVDTSSLSCVTTVPTTELTAMYGAVVPDVVDRGVCDWGGWLDTALAAALGAAELDAEVSADGVGVDRRWAVGSPAPWIAAVDPASAPGAGLAGAVALPVLGLALDAAWRDAVALLGSVTVEEAGAELTLTAQSVASGAGALAADSDGAAFLPAPVAVTLSVEDVPCATVHVVPEPVSLVLDNSAVVLSGAPRFAGLDALHTCTIAPDRLAELADAALARAEAALLMEWHVAMGLAQAGAAVQVEVDGSDVRQVVVVPAP